MFSIKETSYFFDANFICYSRSINVYIYRFSIDEHLQSIHNWYIEIMKNHFRTNVTDFVDDIDEAYQIVSISSRKYDLRQNWQDRHDSEWNIAVLTDNSSSSNTDYQLPKIYYIYIYIYIYIYEFLPDQRRHPVVLLRKVSVHTLSFRSYLNNALNHHPDLLSSQDRSRKKHNQTNYVIILAELCVVGERIWKRSDNTY